MFSEKEKKDLDLLVEIGEKQSGKISSMLVSNYWVELSSEKQTIIMTYNKIYRNISINFSCLKFFAFLCKILILNK